MASIVAALDFQPDSHAAFKAACDMALSKDCPLVLVHASPGRFLAPGPEWAVPDLHADVETVAAEDEAIELTAWAEKARALGIHVETVAREGDPVQVIMDAADEHDADLIITGSHHRGPVGRLLMGSISKALVAKSERPVLVVPQATGRPPRPLRGGKRPPRQSSSQIMSANQNQEY